MTLLLALTGEFATISGLVHALEHGRGGSLTGWGISFVAGLIGAGAIAAASSSGPSAVGEAVRPAALGLAGALVGFGTPAWATAALL